MILYSDVHTKMLESNGQWFTCIEYLHDQWKMNKEDISLFLKIAVNTWYTLTLDGPELSLKKEEFDALNQMLNQSYSFFRTSFSHDENCQWLFGYMITVRTDLFLNSGLEYTAIEQQGEALIEKASKNGNMFAQLLYAVENCSKKEIEKYREKVREHISECFDESQEADRYFIEVLTTDF